MRNVSCYGRWPSHKSNESSPRSKLRSLRMELEGKVVSICEAQLPERPWWLEDSLNIFFADKVLREFLLESLGA